MSEFFFLLFSNDAGRREKRETVKKSFLSPFERSEKTVRLFLLSPFSSSERVRKRERENEMSDPIFPSVSFPLSLSFCSLLSNDAGRKATGVFREREREQKGLLSVSSLRSEGALFCRISFFSFHHAIQRAPSFRK